MLTFDAVQFLKSMKFETPAKPPATSIYPAEMISISVAVQFSTFVTEFAENVVELYQVSPIKPPAPLVLPLLSILIPLTDEPLIPAPVLR